MAGQLIRGQRRANAFVCPHCGAFAAMQWFDTIAIQRTGRGTLGPEVFDQDVHRDWSAAVCASCHGWNLWDKGTMFYPAIATAPLPSLDLS